MKPCRHDTPKDGCRLCWLYENEDKYRAVWDDNSIIIESSVSPAQTFSAFTSEKRSEVERIKKIILKPCLHLGMALEEKPSCGCNGSKSAILHECARHGKCRPYAPRQNENRQCIECPDYIDGKS